jgi:beta-lactamase regulating signal transducer with metallopeptidase domain
MPIAALNLQSLAQLSAERLLNCAAEGMIIALLAWLLLRAVGPQNSGTRFAVWFAALLGIATLPLLGHWSATGAELTTRSEFTMPASWALYIFTAWLLIAAARLLRVGLGFWQLQQLRKSCMPVDRATLDPMILKTLREFESPRPAELCVSDELRVPTAIGFTKPMVAIPSWAMQELSTAELNAVLLHELAHLRRRDDWTNLVQKVVGAALFFHPAVWWIEKKLALEREMACDDLVLAHAKATSPRAYAECLIALAEKSFLRRGFALAQAAVDRVRQVSLRVAQILDANRPSATRVWRPAPVLVAGMSVVCLVALSNAPTRLVSFEGSAEPSSLATNAVASGNFEADQWSQIGAHVVPAKLVLSTGSNSAKKETKSFVSAVAKNSVAGKKIQKQVAAPEVIPAAAARGRTLVPTLLRTSMEENAVTPQTLLFVTRTEYVQTRRVDASGAVVWDLSVWQVTVVGPAQDMMAAGIVAKSI